jgi:hypothetical protein
MAIGFHPPLPFQPLGVPSVQAGGAGARQQEEAAADGAPAEVSVCGETG